MPKIKCICKNCGATFISIRSDRTSACSNYCNSRKHGMSRTKIYKVYLCMIERCTKKDHHAYHHYGGRGITVCEEWLDSFQNFYRDMGESNGKSLDRIDNNKGYSKDNCRWATREEQSNNTRRTKLLTYKGKTLGVSQWSRKLGIPTSTIWNRLIRGWDDKETLSGVRKK